MSGEKTQQQYLDDFFSTQDDLINFQEKEGSISKRTRSRSPQRPIKKSRKQEPEEPLLLSSFNFLFVPYRKSSKILKAKSDAFKNNGAEISGELNSSVTHILVGKNWTKRDVLNSLNIDELPEDVKVIRETFPSDCIEKGRTLDYNDKQYQVDDDRANDSFKKKKEEGENPEVKADEDDSKQQDPPGTLLDQAIEESRLHQEAEQYISDEEEDDDSKSAETKKANWTMNYMCMTGSLSPEQNLKKNPNERVIRLLSLMRQHYQNIKDEWRAQGYRKAISTLKSQTEKITTAKQAKKLPGIGDRISKKIEEIVKTGHLQRLEEAERDPAAKVIEMLLKIHGVGPKIAKRWYGDGVRTLQDARTRPDLTSSQRIGIEHYDEFNERMPRSVVEKHYEIVKTSLEKIDPKAEAILMGSYRRGLPDCGDIDVIITKKNTQLKDLAPILTELRKDLSAKDFIQCSLSGPREENSKWYGASTIPGDPKWRRLDFLLVPWSQRGAALIYYTGNDLFNRSIRTVAQHKGYQLNQKGLFKKPPDGHSEPSMNDLVEGVDEKRIFDILGVQYRPPTERNP